MLAAEAVAELVELGVHVPLVGKVRNGARGEPRQPLAFPLDVGRDAGAFDRHPVGQAVPWASSSASVAGRVGIAAFERIARSERVTEDPRRLVRDERVLAAPPGAVARAERVEVDGAPVLVEPRALPGRPVAVDGASEVGQPAEDVVEPAVPRPVGVPLEDGEGTGPVREVDGQGALITPPGREAEVRERAAPLLHCPVGAVRRLAGGDDVNEGWAVIRAAGVPEAELPAERAPAAGAVEPELHLLAGLARMARVDHVPVPPARAIGQHRLAVTRDLQPDARRIPVDQLRRRSGRRKDGGGYDGGKKESAHGIPRAPTLATPPPNGASRACRSGCRAGCSSSARAPRGW